MQIVKTSEAKNRLSEFIQMVRAGEEVVITSHGNPVAKLVPVDSPLSAEQRRKARAVAEWVEANRHNNKLGGLRIKDLIEEGRR